MKTNNLIPIITLIAGILTPHKLHALEVHEWGTFTILSSSIGQQVPWYQAYSDLAKLPSFTHSMGFGASKSSAAFTVRMETPVIYFYPEKEMHLSAEVHFVNGGITERFPASISNPLAEMMNTPTNPTVYKTKWSGHLLPPNHADASLIPPVKQEDGENYAAARNVPDAWIFHSDTPVIKVKDQPDIHPVEKFIFYRGAGESSPPLYASMSDDNTMTLSNLGVAASSFQVALQVSNNQAAWVKLPALPILDRDKPMSEQCSYVTGTFPPTKISLEQADKELSALFLAELTARGLTEAEAKAMIATWNHTWFAEPGQRIFTIVDRSWVDSVLPLTITPTPKKIERVFVARFEVTAPSTENQLSKLLHTKEPSEADVAQWQTLQLGRFAQGAATIVAEQTKNQMLGTFYRLRNCAITQKLSTTE